MDFNSTPVPAPIDGESRVDVLASERWIPWKRVGWFGGALAVLMVAGFAFAKLSPDETTEQQNTDRQYRVKVTKRTFARAPATVAPPVVEQKAVEQKAPEKEQEPEIEIRTVVQYRDRPAPAIPTIHKSRSMSTQVAYTVSDDGQQASTFAEPSVSGGESSGGAATGGIATDGVTRAYATELQNTDRLLIQNTKIPCTLHNALNTQLAGDVSCTVAANIYSADNSRVLVAKGSIANGKYQIETTSSAVTRIGVIWGRIRTTDNMVANLASNTTDGQGASGIPANSVNYHFWQKYGTAFGVSLVEGALRNIGRNDTNADVVVNSATGVSSDIASRILDASINMPTTREVLPGQQIIIFMQGDVEFEPLS